MPKRSSKYWKQRYDQIEQAANNQSVAYIHSLEEKYRAAEKQIDDKINAWYQRLADNNGVSMTEARKLLTNSELKEFKWTVEQYIKAGEENAVDKRWMKELENASAKFHINRLEALKIEARQQIEVATGGMADDVDNLIKSVYSDTFYRSCFEFQKGVGVGFDVSGLDSGKVSKLISKPWSVDGTNFSEKLWGNKAKLINTLDQELSRMVLTGESPRRAIANIKKTMGTSMASAKRLVMTEQAYFTSLAQKDAYGELDVEEYEFVGTLDGETCGDCGDLDGKHFPVTEMTVGVNAPPMHPYCRCTTCPYFDDEFTNGLRVSRDEEGNTLYEVPEKMTYKEWKDSFVYGGSKGDMQSLKTTVDSKNNMYYNVVRTETELQSVADGVAKDISSYSTNKSKWSGKVIVDNSLELNGTTGRKEWSCDITLIDTADDGVVWHEMLHSCSISYYDVGVLIDNQRIEEASVEFLKQQICKERQIISSGTYEDYVQILESLNDRFCYGTNLEFAKELFNIPLPDRYQWLEDKVDDSLRKMNASFEDYNDVMFFLQQLKGAI